MTSSTVPTAGAGSASKTSAGGGLGCGATAGSMEVLRWLAGAQQQHVPRRREEAEGEDHGLPSIRWWRLTVKRLSRKLAVVPEYG